ncbi:MAG: glycosyltransferase family 2 protein [Candidatus Nanohaloarchaea archaeon]
MEEPLVSVVIATHNRKEDLRQAVESVLNQDYSKIEIIVVSSSNDGTEDLFREGGCFKDLVRFLPTSERYGVSGSRNMGYEEAEGKYIINLDDDAVLQSSKTVSRVVEEFENDEELGIIAFRSEDYETGRLLYFDFPDLANQKNPVERFSASFFTGVGNAFRKDLLEEVGNLPEDFYYGFEEFDFSFRVLDRGYGIRYIPELVVRHKVSQEGRINESEVKAQKFKNRVKVAIRNLPKRYVACTFAFWLPVFLIQSRDFRGVLNSLTDVLRDFREEERRVISKDTIREIKSNSGPLWFWIFGLPSDGVLSFIIGNSGRS